MLKFVKHHMDSILNIEIFPLISLCIFFTFFIALLIWVFRAKKDYINHVASLPLRDENAESNKNLN